jgi:pre-mRNA-splicing factor ATP-dependent RNA helicase DHX16
MEESTSPEILRANLDSTVLLLNSLGISDVLNFDWIDSPSSEALVESLNVLYSLGCLDSKGQLTKRGRMSESLLSFRNNSTLTLCLSV